MPNIGFCEIYFQTAYDPSVAPPGRHLVSVFAQYAPYTLAEGDWDSRRDGIGRPILDAMASFAPDLHDCVEDYEVLGPPDIEARIGLTGGHIFQGETMPDQMWEHRLTPRTPVPGLYLCGSGAHPGGAVTGAPGYLAAFGVKPRFEDKGLRTLKGGLLNQGLTIRAMYPLGAGDAPDRDRAHSVRSPIPRIFAACSRLPLTSLSVLRISSFSACVAGPMSNAFCSP